MPRPYVKVMGVMLLFIVVVASSFIIMSKSSSGEEPTTGASRGGEPATISQQAQGQYRVRIDTNTRLLAGYPAIVIGPRDAKLELYVFYDLECPYCAREFTESLDYMVSLTEKGIKLVFADMVVHPQAVDMHAELRCIAANGGPYVEVLKDLYTRFIDKGEPPTMDYLKQLEAKYGYSAANGDCVKKEKYNAVSMTQYAVQQLGIPGTPTKVIYDLEKNKAWALPGYTPLEAFKKYIEDALAGKDLSTRQPS